MTFQVSQYILCLTMDSKPSLRDWMLASIGIIFVLMGIVILPSNRNVGIMTLAMFGTCAILSIRRIMRKLRYRRLNINEVNVVSGTKIQPSRIKAATLGATLFCLGIVLLVFKPDDAPLIIRACFGIIAGAGAFVLISIACGVSLGQSLEFTPDGLVFSYRSWSAILPWEQIKKASEGEIQNNPTLFMWLDSPEHFKVSPPEKQEKFMSYMEQCRALTGADIFLITSQYDVDLPILFSAIDKYRTNPESLPQMNALRS